MAFAAAALMLVLVSMSPRPGATGAPLSAE
jgi:hypothetical protein